jgi:hypothetical protein
VSVVAQHLFDGRHGCEGGVEALQLLCVAPSPGVPLNRADTAPEKAGNLRLAKEAEVE